MRPTRPRSHPSLPRRRRSRPLWAQALHDAALGMLQTGVLVFAVVAVGLVAGWAGAPEPAPGPVPRPAPALYTPGPATSEEAPLLERERWLVDGFNVLHVAILQGRERGRWWKEEGRTQLLERAAGFQDPDARVCIVFDGPRPAEPEEGASPAQADAPEVVFAPNADDWLLAEVRAADDPSAVTIVTADRKLADRARHRGARVVSPRHFLERCSA